MDYSATRDWSLSYEGMGFRSSLPQSVCREVALQICCVRNAGKFIEDWVSLDERAIDYAASQLKRCSSSEVAVMIDGVLRHCTNLERQRQYVDSHVRAPSALPSATFSGLNWLPA
jgi:TnpA family transposase